MCFDFETGSADPKTTQIIQIAAVGINTRRLTITDSFESLICPEDMDAIEDGALAVNKKTREELATAPHPEVVWKQFANFVNKFNYKKTPYTAPIPCGYNIRGFDMPIVERYCQMYGPIDAKKGCQGLFNSFLMWDVMDDIYRWTENTKDIPNMKLDTVREYMGISTANSHDALVDVKHTAAIAIRYMGLYRKLYAKIPFKGAFSGQEI